MSATKLTPEQFIGACRLFGGPDQAVQCIKSECWPDFAELAVHLENMADELNPDKGTDLSKHFELMALALWAREQV